MVTSKPEKSTFCVKHFVSRVLACAACGLCTLFSTVAAQEADRYCERVERNSKGLEIWMWSEPAEELDLFSPYTILGPPESSALPSLPGWGDVELQPAITALPAEDEEDSREGRGYGDDLPVPSEEAAAATGPIVSPPRTGPQIQTVEPDRHGTPPEGAFSFATDLLPLFSLLAGLPFCLLVLVVALWFLLRLLARRHGLTLRVELVNAQNAAGAAAWQDRFHSSFASEATVPVRVRNEQEAGQGAEGEEPTLLRQVLDANLGLREQISRREAGAA